MSTSCLAVEEGPHSVWLRKRSRMEVNEEAIRHDQEVDGISPAGLLLFKQFAQGETRIPHHHHANRFSQFFWDDRNADTQIIFQKKEVALVDPVNVSRGVEGVKQTKGLGVGFSRRTRPGSIGKLHVAMWHLLGQLQQSLFHFTFQPSSTILPDDKEVRRMDGTDTPVAVFALIR